MDFVPRNNWFYFNIKANTKKESLLSSTDLTTALLAAFTKITTVVNEINHFCPLDVSVVIPVHNREKLILKCINSLNNQTINKDRFEVIFVDDCSSDKSIAAIEYNIAPDINYRIIRREIGNGHLSRQKFPLEDRHFILNSVINTIYFCGKTNEEKAKLYNAWLVICLEMMEKVCGKAGGNEQKKRMFFNMLSTTFNIRSDLVNQDMIYTPQRKFIKPFLQNNYEGFIAEI
ncbi:glycosyltransferase family 2 protein [Escherichia coli]|uniref:glycosyltransferase family 2 protein n=1 Tax=Escherichia coli TaxID=562 RepID=UPI00175C58EF|nr:glycosyltransferase [Escherichia coli]HCA4513867.1 glycosyltransferase family 2 protein [Escherichia coli]